jgi:hypothetical protein
MPPAVVLLSLALVVMLGAVLMLWLLLLLLLQVVPSQGVSVLPGHSYTLRIAVADANHGLVDSVLMLPAGAVRLVAGPTAAAGGPYAVVSTCRECTCILGTWLVP